MGHVSDLKIFFQKNLTQPVTNRRPPAYILKTSSEEPENPQKSTAGKPETRKSRHNLKNADKMTVRNIVYGFLTIIVLTGAANMAGAQSASAAVKWVKKEMVPVIKGEKNLEIKIKRKKTTLKASEQISVQMKYTPGNTMIADSEIYTTEF